MICLYYKTMSKEQVFQTAIAYIITKPVLSYIILLVLWLLQLLTRENFAMKVKLLLHLYQDLDG